MSHLPGNLQECLFHKRKSFWLGISWFMYAKVALSSLSSCLNFPAAGILDLDCHVQLDTYFDNTVLCIITILSHITSHVALEMTN